MWPRRRPEAAYSALKMTNGEKQTVVLQYLDHIAAAPETERIYYDWTDFELDLASFIDPMPEPDRGLCHAAMQGKTIREISEQLHIHPRTARRRIKKALAPLDTRLTLARERRGRKPGGGVGSPAEASGFHYRGSNRKTRDTFFFLILDMPRPWCYIPSVASTSRSRRAFQGPPTPRR